MTKIVYNNCYGGFGLSTEAVERYFELKGWTLVIDGGGYFAHYYKDSIGEGNYFSCREIDRADPVLVQVVEELGDKANGVCAKLAIRKLPSGTKYRIDVYDGNESVVTQDEYGWRTAR